MVTLALAVLAYVRTFFLPRHNLALEAAALRQQLAVFKRKQPRPQLHRLDRLFWIALRRLWSGWAESLIIVKPETVVSWTAASPASILLKGNGLRGSRGSHKLPARAWPKEILVGISSVN